MGRLLPVVWSHTTKSMLMNSQSRKSKICSSLMTEPSLSLIHAERNPRNSVVQEPEQDTKSLTVKYVFTVTTCPCSTRTAPQAGERHLPCYIFLFTLFIANKLREREKTCVLLLEEFRMMNRTIIPIRRLTNVRG